MSSGRTAAGSLGVAFVFAIFRCRHYGDGLCRLYRFLGATPLIQRRSRFWEQAAWDIVQKSGSPLARDAEASTTRERIIELGQKGVRK
jgi:hypothetical protein